MQAKKTVVGASCSLHYCLQNQIYLYVWDAHTNTLLSPSKKACQPDYDSGLV
ncbi:hypothetical protein Cal7507_4024 [Calothrix sp. PCC 7507]|nr:hypothetical protein Cal7507_4024 [Calothrix sp. PCC 7507]